jgi:hypothetical protein
LGGDFWDKLRSLFVREARAVFPERKDESTSSAALFDAGIILSFVKASEFCIQSIETLGYT